MGIELDIATTATLRPGLYIQTLESFWPSLERWANWRLILNIDCIGEPDVDPLLILDIAKSRFSNIDVRVSRTPDFPTAWKWCATKLKAPYVFWLEDDWEALDVFDVHDMWTILEANPDLACLRLPRWPSGPDWFRQWNKRKMAGWNGRFMEIPKKHRRGCGYSGNPGFVRRDFLAPILESGILEKRDEDIEKQFYGFNPPLAAWARQWRYGVYQKPNSPPLARDIGEQWRKTHKWDKGDKLRFRTWVPR
jgi:hypothetical protein